MPSGWSYDTYPHRCKMLRLAEQQVRAKFPDLNEKTDGWSRAVSNRYKRLMKW